MKRTHLSTKRRSMLAIGLIGTLVLSACGKEEAPPPPPPTPVTPVAFNQTATVNEGSTLALTLTGEAGPDEALTFTIVTAPEHGTLEGAAPNLTYIPAAHFLGSDRFTFTVGAGDRASAPAVVEVEVLNAPFYTITRGNESKSSRLYFTNAHGVAALVGDTGHALVSIKVDPTDGKIYAATRRDDFEAACDDCLVTLDPATGAATIIGPLDVDADPSSTNGPIPSLAFRQDGDLFGYTENSDQPVAIDKATGAVTLLGDSTVSSYGHGMWTDGADTLWFINGDSSIYTVNPVSGEMTLIHEGEVLLSSLDVALGELITRGDRNPLTGAYWGVTNDYGNVVVSGIARVAITAESAQYIDSPKVELVPGAHNLAFAR